MKKTLIAFAAAAALTTSAFAEITFGAWLRTLAAPVASDGKDTVTAMGNSWGGIRQARLDVRGTAEDGNVGFVFGAYENGGAIEPGDDGFVWAKPVDAVKVSFGHYDGPTPLRGDIAYGVWDWLRPNGCWVEGDEGLLMSGKTKDGVKVEITPMDGLYILGLVPIYDSVKTAETTYKNIQAGAAYDIDGVGKIKAQFIGDFTAKDEATNKDAVFNKVLEAEFDLTAVENLWLGLGFQYNMYDGDAKYSEITVDTTTGDVTLDAKKAMKIALGARYQVSDMIGLSASGAFFTYNKDADDVKVDPRFQVGAGVNAAVADGVNVTADVRYVSPVKVDGEKADNTDHIAFSAGVTKSISSNGHIGAAFEAATNGAGFSIIPAADGKEDKLTWCVPVVIQVGF